MIISTEGDLNKKLNTGSDLNELVELINGYTQKLRDLSMLTSETYCSEKMAEPELLTEYLFLLEADFYKLEFSLLELASQLKSSPCLMSILSPEFEKLAVQMERISSISSAGLGNFGFPAIRNELRNLDEKLVKCQIVVNRILFD